ncbi:MAG: gas vesicle protein GvpG [Pseudanabaenaceae cyanobacterium bins.68]|nr:gas vesicle protein GvpG [Pseudanabaenaceae cyanobacterium bins.68]
MVWQLITAPLQGLLWVAEQIEDRALTEQEQQNLSKRLIALQLKFDLGEIAEADFISQEQELLAAIAAELDRPKT